MLKYSTPVGWVICDGLVGHKSITPMWMEPFFPLFVRKWIAVCQWNKLLYLKATGYLRCRWVSSFGSHISQVWEILTVQLVPSYHYWGPQPYLTYVMFVDRIFLYDLPWCAPPSLQVIFKPLICAAATNTVSLIGLMNRIFYYFCNDDSSFFLLLLVYVLLLLSYISYQTTLCK